MSHHQCGISVLVSQTSFREETIGDLVSVAWNQWWPSFSSVRKQPTFRDTTTCFPVKWSKFLANQRHYPDLGSVTSSISYFCAHFSDIISWGNYWWPSFSSVRKQPTFRDTTTCFPVKWSKFLANQRHYPDLGSVTSSISNFCAHFQDIISRGNQWWHCKMSALFLGYIPRVLSYLQGQVVH